MTWVRGRSYSQDLRERVLAADGLSARKVAAQFSVSVSYGVKARQRRERTGALTTKPRGHRTTPRVSGLEPAIEREVERRPSATLADLRAWLLGAHGVSVSVGTMWKTLRELGLTLKKSRCGPPGKVARTSPPRATNGASCSSAEPERLVFLDETCTKTNMVPMRGRSRRGQRLVGSAPFGHWNTTTLLAGLRDDRIVAPLVLSRPVNGRSFRAYVEQFLARTLTPGDIVVADNLGSHKVAGVREAIEARGASLLFLPPYSPDLNPIEQVSAKLKTLLRRAQPRTRERLWTSIGSCLDRFSAAECLNYFANSGYRQTR